MFIIIIIIRDSRKIQGDKNRRAMTAYNLNPQLNKNGNNISRFETEIKYMDKSGCDVSPYQFIRKMLDGVEFPHNILN